jgi:hypothetical protein
MKLTQDKSKHHVKKELICDNMKGRSKLAKAVKLLTFVLEVPGSAVVRDNIVFGQWPGWCPV